MIASAHPFSLSGKTILVTGAGSGIGAACCRALTSAGAVVIATGRKPEALASVLRDCVGDENRAMVADLTQAEALRSLVEGCPTLAGIVHAAGVCGLKPAKFSDIGFLRSQLDVNLVAPLLLTAALLKQARLAEGASVVFMGSAAAACGESAMSVYAAGKGGIESAARALAIELAPRGIRVNTIAPGSVMTPLLDELFSAMSDASRLALARNHPLGLGRPEDVAHAATYLLSPAARWVTGTTLRIDGGYSAK